MQEGIAVGRSFAMFKNYHIDGNKEMIAFGMMNIVGSCTSCYLTTGNISIVLLYMINCRFRAGSNSLQFLFIIKNMKFEKILGTVIVHYCLGPVRVQIDSQSCLVGPILLFFFWYRKIAAKKFIN